MSMDDDTTNINCVRKVAMTLIKSEKGKAKVCQVKWNIPIKESQPRSSVYYNLYGKFKMSD